jgi:hypothetical protein
MQRRRGGGRDIVGHGQPEVGANYAVREVFVTCIMRSLALVHRAFLGAYPEYTWGEVDMIPAWTKCRAQAIGSVHHTVVHEACLNAGQQPFTVITTMTSNDTTCEGRCVGTDGRTGPNGKNSSDDDEGGR